VEEWRSLAAAFAPPSDIECRDGSIAMHEFLARPSSAGKARAALRGFLQACGVGPDRISEIQTASGEAVANAIEHAYDPRTSGPFFLSLYACPRHQRIVVQVRDQGRMQTADSKGGGRGFGSLIMRALTTSVDVETATGTCVTMLFRP
jgi:anti-sigma regulatory factor (Ser/Thr protein kinase)